jgi:hypothetical protein
MDLPNRLSIHRMDVVECEAFPVIQGDNQQGSATSHRLDPELQAGRCGQIPDADQQDTEDQETFESGI